MGVAGGRALRVVLAALGLLWALSAAATLFLLAQWRELGAALRELQVAGGSVRGQAGPSAALRELQVAGGSVRRQEGPGTATPGVPRSKRSRRGHVRAETDEMMLLLTYSMVPVGRGGHLAKEKVRAWRGRNKAAPPPAGVSEL